MLQHQQPSRCVNLLLRFANVAFCIVAISSALQFAETKRNQRLLSTQNVKCKSEIECQLSQQYLNLYSFVKSSLESDFDIRGREIMPFIRAVEVLQKRFDVLPNASDTNSNSTSSELKIIKDLLSDEKLRNATRILQSTQARRLINLYRSSVNGRGQNLACTQWRTDDLVDAAAELDKDPNLAALFGKIHKRYAKKSAKKCLKVSCNSLDTQMSRLDSVLGKHRSSSTSSSSARDDDNNNNNNSSSKLEVEAGLNQVKKGVAEKREFQAEELELCRFFKRSTDTTPSECVISGNELSEIKFTQDLASNGNERNQTSLSEYLNAYSLVGQSSTFEQPPAIAGFSPEESVKLHRIRAQCDRFSSLLSYNLHALKWYESKGLIESSKISTRSFWCPSLSYWLEMDRLCAEIASSMADRTVFSY